MLPGPLHGHHSRPGTPEQKTWSTFPPKQCCGAGPILTGSGLFSAGSSSYKKWPFNHTFFLQHPTFLTRKKSFIFKNLYNLLLKVSSFEKNKYNNCKYSEPPVEGGSTAGGECYCQRDQLFPPPTHFFGEPSFHRDGNAQGDPCSVPRDSLGKPSSLVSGYTNADGGAQILTKIIDLFRDTVPKSCFTKYIRPSIMQNLIISTKKRQSIEVNHNRFVQ